MFEIIENNAGLFVKVKSVFIGTEWNEVKLVRYFQFEQGANKEKLETRLTLQNPDFLRKNIEEILIPKGKCEAVNPAELADEI